MALQGDGDEDPDTMWLGYLAALREKAAAGKLGWRTPTDVDALAASFVNPPSPAIECTAPALPVRALRHSKERVGLVMLEWIS